MSSIQVSELGGQLAVEVYKQFLTLAERQMSQRPDSRRCDWRFHPPQRPPQAEARLRAYWGGLFHRELTALDADWAAPRMIAIITDELTSAESSHDNSASTSQSA